MITSIPQDNDRDIWFANRLLALIHPKQPFVDWVNRVTPQAEGEHHIEEERMYPSPYLIPFFEGTDDAWGWLEQNCELLFETHLWRWAAEPAAWPGERTWSVFNDWFEIELLEAPWDLVAEPLHSNPPPPDSAWH